MPAVYKRKTDFKTPTKEVLVSALKQIKIDKASVLSVAKKIQIPKTNLHRLVDAFNARVKSDEITQKNIKEFVDSHRSVPGVPTILSKQQEGELMTYAATASRICYGLTIKELRMMAFAFAKKLKIPYPDSWNETKIAGKDWYYGFMKRYPNLSLRTPEQLSMARAKAFNKETVFDFYSKLEAVLNLNDYPRHRIWNMDESGFPTVPTKISKIISEKGRKRIAQMSPAERGTNVTVAVAVNAAGTVIPPFFLFPSKNMMTRYLDNASSECVGYANGSGWMQQNEFLKFIVHFIRHSNAHKDRPTLLLLDNHVSHLSVEALDLAVEHGITILSFPPHCSHRMQPLDCGIFSPVKARYAEKYSTWMKNHAGKVFEIHHVAPIVEECLDEAVTPHIVKHAFKRTGVYPFNPNIFSNDEFIAARMCNRVQDELEEDVDNLRVIHVLEPSNNVVEGPCIRSILNDVGPVQPAEARKKSNRGRKSMQSAVLTSPECLNQLKEQAEKRQANKAKKDAKTKEPPRKRGRPSLKPV